MTNFIGIAWNVVGLFEHASGDPMANYYYATYDTTAEAVKNVSNIGGDANIYPVPAQNMLHVDLNWDVLQKLLQYPFITHMGSKIVRQWNTPAGSSVQQRCFFRQPGF